MRRLIYTWKLLSQAQVGRKFIPKDRLGAKLFTQNRVAMLGLESGTYVWVLVDSCLDFGTNTYLFGLLKILRTNSLNSGVTFEGAPESNGGCGSYSMAN